MLGPPRAPLGDGTLEQRLTPVDVFGMSNAVQVAAGEGHTCALRRDGSVWCWGGHLGLEYSLVPVAIPNIRNAKAVAAGIQSTCVLLASGDVLCLGYDGAAEPRSTPFKVTGNAQAVASGFGHTCALLTSGAMQCWGNNFNGELGDGTTTFRDSPVMVLGF
jgi:alpha-tubulin suppressor-like RCC1 family protein